MNMLNMIVLAALCAAPLARAEAPQLPTGVYPLGQLAKARDAAAKGGKALAFVLSELKGKAARQAAPNTLYAFRKLMGVCVPVYVDYLDDLKTLPDKLPLVAGELASSQAGKTIPRIAATDPAITRLLAIISTLPEGPFGDGVYQDACQQIQDYLKDPDKRVIAEKAAKKGKKRHNDQDL
jgi:hypothetical protein